MGQIVSAFLHCFSSLTGRGQGDVRLTEGDEESAPEASALTLSVNQDAGPKPVHIAYVAIRYSVASQFLCLH